MIPPLSPSSRPRMAFLRARGGAVAVIFAIAAIPLMIAAGAAVDSWRAAGMQVRLQNALDASLLIGIQAVGAETAKAEASFYGDFSPNMPYTDLSVSYSLAGNALSGTAELKMTNAFGGILGLASTTLKVTGSAQRTFSSPCIYVLDPSAGQALLVNSGARITAPDCEIHVRSAASPAAIINAGSRMGFKRICISGTNIIRNSQEQMPIELGCNASADPYAGRLPRPTAGACTNTRQVYDPPAGGGTHVMPANSTWCNLIFNGSPSIRFEPGLHIVKGQMIINSGARVTGTGVTFFFPDTSSEIRFNGGITSTLSAPTSGTYANILMFEPSGGYTRTQYVFNGTVSEELSGLIYLPNRNVTYNATSNVTGSKLTLVVNQLILNNLNWKLLPGSAPAGAEGGAVSGVRLTQ